MTGLEKILADIRAESDKAAKQQMEQAQETADAIRKQQAERTKESCNAIAAESERAVAAKRARAASGAQLNRNRLMLATKQEILSQTLEAALHAIEALPDAAYFDLILQIAAGCAHAQTGEIRFGAKDLARVPADFTDKLNKVLPEGAHLTLSNEPAPIGSGFLLVYGDILENNGFADLLAARREELQDKIAGILFA